MNEFDLIWNEKVGWGFQAPETNCSKDYWHEYRAKDRTPMGRVLTAVRAGMVRNWTRERALDIVDIGIGGGAFCDEMDCHGFDVNVSALAWLKKEALDWEPEKIPVMTFWDSIEHILYPGNLLKKVTKKVFLSTPIYRDKEHCLASKHYKPNEHLWYFTDKGIKKFMHQAGFALIYQNRIEEDAGREDIGSYVFGRA